jgi:ABC-2 type transport system ATP-binding protein
MNSMTKKDVIPAIEFLQVTKTFARGARRAVHEVSLSVRPGEIFGLVGPNGAGKTTLLRLAAGILAPDGGKVRLAGIDLAAEPLKAKKLLGYAAADPLLYERMTGSRYLSFIAAAFGLARSAGKKIGALAEEFGLREMMADPIGHYPPGLRQKLSLVSVFLHEPVVYVLDEPWANLDPGTADLVRNKLKVAVSLGSAVLYTTHFLDIAQKFSQRLGVMRRGSLAAAGTFTALKKAVGAKGATLETVLMELTR